MSEFRFYPNYGLKTRRRRKKVIEPGSTLRLLRVAAEVRVGERVIPVRVLLSDIFPRAIFLFSSEPVAPDTELAVTIEAPRQFYAIGRVVSCRDYIASSRVIERERYPYRICVGFRFNSEADAQEVRDYVADLRVRFVYR